MQEFAALLDALYFTSATKAKSRIFQDYLRQAPDPDRGWAIAAIAGELKFDLFKRPLIKKVVTERVDPVLYDLCYDYVGETSETVAHLWPETIDTEQPLPSLSHVVAQFQAANAAETEALLIDLLSRMTASQRWALLKLGTRGLRIGISSRQMKNILADYGEIDVAEIEAIWHGLEPPYSPLLAWLEGRADKPDISGKITFRPLMLSHPLDAADLAKITAETFQAEYKYDGIRVQLVSMPHGKALFSRTGDDISDSFPDLLAETAFEGVFDGELLVRNGDKIGSFNQLQQRLNKKKPSKKLQSQYPAVMMLYDVLVADGQDCTAAPLFQRRQVLEQKVARINNSRFYLSPTLDFGNDRDLAQLRNQAQTEHASEVEGIMLKRLDSVYMAGRPSGQWYKWKRDPKTIDAILMYAQRGHGKRSSFYSDFTFGLWQQEQILPVGKAYSGFTDEELKKLDRWVRNNTIAKYGPVREVAKSLVVEIAFDDVHHSKRHKSGVALRFPRFKHIRWDKPVDEADLLYNLERMIVTPS